MNAEEAIEKIKRKVIAIDELCSKPRFCPEYMKWHRETVVLLQRIFGANAYQVADFSNIQFVYHGIHRRGDSAPFERRYRTALDEAAAILTSIHEEIQEFGLQSSLQPAIALSVVDTLIKRFHAVARQLRARHEQRPTLDVADEYDVQRFASRSSTHPIR